MATKFQDIKYNLNIVINSTDSNIIEFYNKFNYIHYGDSGIDLYNNDITIEPLMIDTINFKISCEMIDIDSNEYVSYYLAPRSSLAKTSFQLANSIGIIDAGYRGNIMAKIRCFHNSSDTLEKGSYFQIIAPDLKPIQLNIVTELSSTDRNNKAYGSTK